ncbi:hypothetical protein KXJ72_17530 (plasmid) [Comamonas aquatica]|nr:hypothetical protein KXJ72_17530 [Comamonas aquatica]
MNDENFWCRTWSIRVWDGNTTHEYTRYGTYEQVTAPLRAAPESYIWSAC